MHGVPMVRSARDGAVCHRYNLYDQADKLVSKSSFPEQASNNQLARYLCALQIRLSLLDAPLPQLAAITHRRTLARCRYYLGRIKSIQLDYTEALRNLQQALRKAPQSSATGFRITVHPMAHQQERSLCLRFAVRRTPQFDLVADVATCLAEVSL